MSTPAAYISYAWGDDKTPDGLEREAIVEDLCRSFTEVGIVIGRDKNEVRPGDSIEAFGVRIAKAPLILAVISARSLRSEWCMLYELYEAYVRRGGNSQEFAADVVALVLDDAELDLDDSKPLVNYWKTKYVRYKEMLDAADPNAERSLESRKVLVKCRHMIESLPDMLLAIRRIAMPRGSVAIRRDDFADIRAYVQAKLGISNPHIISHPISEQVFKAWTEYAPLAQRLHALPIDPSPSRAVAPAPLRRPCDAVALVLTPSGQEKGIVRHYQWRAFIQRAGQGPCQQVPNGSLGAKPSYAQGTLEELLRCVQSWIDRELNDEPVLEIFVPDDLLDEDWGSFIVQDDEDPKLLRTYQPFLLRSSDRLLNRKWNKRAGALRRMHHHLAEGTGAWLPQDQITKIDDLETLDGETPDEFSGGAVIAAICLLPSTRLRNRAAWLWSALASMAPLVVWPSQTSSLREEQLQLCLRHLPLIREDTSQGHRVERPHCPDLARLAKARQKWRHPEVDLRGLTILVDHPERGPDRSTLQTLFPTSRDDPSRTSHGEGPDPPDQLLISS